MPPTSGLFRTLTEKDKSQAVEKLISESSPRRDFFLMTGLSILMATFGLILDNSSIVIGSMLVAPLLSPVISLALGVVISDQKLILRAIFTILKAMLLSIGLAALVTIFFLPDFDPYSKVEIVSRIMPNLVLAAVAFVAGLAASYSLIKPTLSESLPGVAISVALIPPIAVTGVGLATWNWSIITGSLILFGINVLAVVFASMIVFSLMNLYVEKSVAKQAVKKDEKVIAKEKAQLEKAPHSHPLRDLIKLIKK